MTCTVRFIDNDRDYDECSASGVNENCPLTLPVVAFGVHQLRSGLASRWQHSLLTNSSLRCSASGVTSRAVSCMR